MRSQPDLARKTHPANPAVTGVALVAEVRVVHRCMARNTIGTRRGGRAVPAIMTGLALHFGMAASKAEHGMVLFNASDLAPIGLVVARDAFGACKSAFVRVLMAGNAFGLQSEKRGVSASVAAVVAVVASNRSVRSLERPPRLTMIETRRAATRPAHEFCVSPEMLDVTLATLLAAIFSSMETCLLSYAPRQVVVAPEAGVGVEPFAGRMAFAAMRVSIDVRMTTGELSRRQKLCPGGARHQRPGHRSRYHEAAYDRQRYGTPTHSEKIQR